MMPMALLHSMKQANTAVGVKSHSLLLLMGWGHIQLRPKSLACTSNYRPPSKKGVRIHRLETV
jgi:hypothetical protein